MPSRVDDVYQVIWDAILEHRLPPDTRLVERHLCEIFGVGRSRIRRVLGRLAHERLITTLPNRGAIVCRPSRTEAREVIGARRIIERGVVGMMLGNTSRRDMQRLKEHVARECAARENNEQAVTRLASEFHFMIAEVTGNDTLVVMQRRLVARSSLITAAYCTPGTPCCSSLEHQGFVDAIEVGDHAAVGRIAEHLDALLARLSVAEAIAPFIDLRSTFARSSRRPTA